MFGKRSDGRRVKKVEPFERIIQIGDQVISQDVYPEYSLHLQTQWRFMHNEQIILGSRDIYEPFSDHVDDNWDYIPQGRADEESSIFDVVSKDLICELTGHHVVQCTCSPAGDICIRFSNGYIFQVFIPASYQEEEWRLIDFKNDEHMIFYDCD